MTDDINVKHDIKKIIEKTGMFNYKITWKGKFPTVILNHSTLSGKREIFINDKKCISERHFFDCGSIYHLGSGKFEFDVEIEISNFSDVNYVLIYNKIKY